MTSGRSKRTHFRKPLLQQPSEPTVTSADVDYHLGVLDVWLEMAEHERVLERGLRHGDSFVVDAFRSADGRLLEVMVQTLGHDGGELAMNVTPFGLHALERFFGDVGIVEPLGDDIPAKVSPELVVRDEVSLSPIVLAATLEEIAPVLALDVGQSELLRQSIALAHRFEDVGTRRLGHGS